MIPSSVGRRTGKRGTLVLKRSYRGVGRIRRLSGTRDKDTLADIIATLDGLYEDGRLDILAQVRDGELRPIDVFRFGVKHAPVIPQKQTYIYAIQAQPSGNIKIGIAGDVEFRLRQMQTNTWEELTVLVSYRGYPEDEQNLHRRFRQHWIAREWFRPGPEVLVWIAEETE